MSPANKTARLRMLRRHQRDQISTALIHGNRFGLAVLANRLLEAAARRDLATMSTQQEIDRVALVGDDAA